MGRGWIVLPEAAWLRGRSPTPAASCRPGARPASARGRRRGSRRAGRRTTRTRRCCRRSAATPVLFGSVPVTAREPTWTPFSHSRWVRAVPGHRQMRPGVQRQRRGAVREQVAARVQVAGRAVEVVVRVERVDELAGLLLQQRGPPDRVRARSGTPRPRASRGWSGRATPRPARSPSRSRRRRSAPTRTCPPWCAWRRRSCRCCRGPTRRSAVGAARLVEAPGADRPGAGRRRRIDGERDGHRLRRAGRAGRGHRDGAGVGAGRQAGRVHGHRQRAGARCR